MIPTRGAEIDEINSYWDNVNNYLNIISPGLVKIWRADNNGQIARNDITRNNLVGNWDISNNEKGNGANLHE